MEDAGSFLAQSLGIDTEAEIFFESHHPFTPSAGDIGLYIFFTVFAILIMTGIVVEYTPLFGNPNYEGIANDDEGKRDKEL